MFTEQPTYSTTLYRRLSREQIFQINVENEWDVIAEAVLGPDAQQNVQVDQLIALLESHGIIAHRIPSPPSESQLGLPRGSPFVTGFSDNQATTSSAPGDLDRNPFFPQDVALVHGSRVIEAPHTGSNPKEKSHINALFSRLERAGVEVIRWPSNPSIEGGKDNLPPEGNLVEVENRLDGGDKDDEGPLFYPSDILILSPTLLITRLSPFTNNKGLQYLWSILSQPPKANPFARNNGELCDDNKPARTTTLLVRMNESDVFATGMSSPRTPTFGTNVLRSPAGKYIPLCRALLPISDNVMLYDPMLVAEGEARRLKSVLDRVRETLRLGGATPGNREASPIFPKSHSKGDSVLSYGTFGSLERVEDGGWQFISVEGLHSTSILLVSSRLALLNLASTTSQVADESSLKSVHEDLVKVTQILESLGVRAVKLPSTGGNLSQLAGVRESVLVLRREPNLEASDDLNGGDNLNNQQQPEEDNPAEGCIGTICGLCSAWFCESLRRTNEAESSDNF